jgi:hypothetical protein
LQRRFQKDLTRDWWLWRLTTRVVIGIRDSRHRPAGKPAISKTNQSLRSAAQSHYESREDDDYWITGEGIKSDVIFVWMIFSVDQFKQEWVDGIADLNLRLWIGERRRVGCLWIRICLGKSAICVRSRLIRASLSKCWRMDFHSTSERQNNHIMNHERMMIIE